MATVTIDNITDVVTASLGPNGAITDLRREIMTSLLKHLHDFCKGVIPHHEFLAPCDYLARAGQICDDKRLEFILLGDIPAAPAAAMERAAARPRAVFANAISGVRPSCSTMLMPATPARHPATRSSECHGVPTGLIRSQIGDR